MSQKKKGTASFMIIPTSHKTHCEDLISMRQVEIKPPVRDDS